MLYGRIVRSPASPCPEIVAIDVEAARRAPGVKAAFAWRDPANPQRNTVMFQGDEVAAVAADTEEHAIDAVAPGQGRVRGAAARDPGGPGTRRQRAGGVSQRQRAAGRDPGNGRPRRRLQAGGPRGRGNLLHARHHARLPRVAWRGLRVGRRSPHRLGLDAGDQRSRGMASPTGSASRRPTCA